MAVPIEELYFSIVLRSSPYIVSICLFSRRSLLLHCPGMCRYGIHLWDVHHEKVWENRAAYVYYAELCFELTALAIDFCHDLHMLVCSFALSLS